MGSDTPHRAPLGMAILGPHTDLLLKPLVPETFITGQFDETGEGSARFLLYNQFTGELVEVEGAGRAQS